MTPSETLSRAADLIRDTAGLALAPPWSASGRSVMRGLDEDHEVALTPTTTTARWIALMSPAVAPMIEKWLREASAAWAKGEESYRRDRSVINPSPGELSGHWGTWNLTLEERVGESDRQALALARAVLGEKEEQE